MSGPAAPSAVHLRADRAAAALGEPFGVEVVLRHDAADRWSVAAEQRLAPFALRGAGCERRADGGEALTRCTATLAREELGDRAPELALRGEGPSGARELAVAVPPVKAVLVSDPGRPAAEIPLAGLAPPVPLLVPTWRPLGVAGLALGLAAVAVLLLRRLARRRGRAAGPAAPTTPPRCADRRLAALAALEATPPPPRELFFALAALAREHVAAVTALPAEALTGRELLARLDDADPSTPLDRGALAALLAVVEPVCFAGATPSPGDPARGIALARAVLGGRR